MQNPKNEYTLAVVGAGPRGTSVVERFADLSSKLAPKDGNLKIVVLDPFRPGSGHVWNPHQSENFWMNTPASFPTVAPERTSVEPGLSFQQFVELHGDGRKLTEEHAKSIKNIDAGTYPSRAIYGEYLEHVFDSSCAALQAHESFSVEHVAAEVLAVRPEGSGYQLEFQRTAGSSEVQMMAVDAVVLALGHQSADLNPWQKQLQEAATTSGAVYLGPNVPADMDFDQFAPGQPALIRGLGLNFFDTMAELTLGRGGLFREVSTDPGHRLEYVAAGREPELIVASRRGTPYWGKPVVDQFIPEEIELRFFDVPDLIGHLAELRSTNPQATLEFSRHIWPNLHRDVLFAYYQQSAQSCGVPEGFSAEGFIEQVDNILSAEHREGSQVWLGELRKFIAQFPEIQWLDVPKLAKPFEEIGFASNEEYQKAVQDYLVDNAQHSAGGLDDPLSCAIMTMNAGRMLVKELIVNGVVDEQSRIEEIQAHFEPLVEGLASGPPLERIEQLLALSRDGVVTFVGPEPEFTFDEVSGQFTASSPWVDAEVHTARTMCEAMMPSNRVLQNNTPLIKQLLSDHVGRVHTWRNSEGETLPGSGFDVVGEPYRLVNSEGLAHRGIFVLGLQLSSAQWGTAIAAQARDLNNPAARTLKDATHVANEVARLAGFLVGEGLPTERI